MKSLIEFLGCGNAHSSNNACNYRIGNLSVITENIIPLFKKYPISSGMRSGVKSLKILLNSIFIFLAPARPDAYSHAPQLRTFLGALKEKAGKEVAQSESE